MGLVSSSTAPKNYQQIEKSSSDQESTVLNPENKKTKTPFNSKVLGFIQNTYGVNSKASTSQIHQERSTILKKYENKTITKLEVYQSPIESSFVLSSSSALKHWEIIATINDCIYWVISFGADGQQNQISLNKENLIERRKENKILKEIPLQKQLLLKNIIYIIDEVQHIQYNIGNWNCQSFVEHISLKIKSI